ncbi:MAG: sporulation protein YabP [Syntrophomonadaceae bacterium]|jgi:sporulation protein YabP
MSEHSFKLVNRSNLELAGVFNVVSFNEEEIILETSMGFLCIAGEDLHITMLNLEAGQVNLQGTVNSLSYKAQGADIKTKSKNIINRLLK